MAATRADDEDAHRVHDMASLEYAKPGITARLVDWLKMYKTSDGKGENFLSNNDLPTSVAEAQEIIDECHQRWVRLKSGLAKAEGFYVTP